MKRLLLLSTLVAFPVVSQAGPVAGKVAFGTWDTQAEFADVKIVKGSQRLYTSTFWTGATGITYSGGTWSASEGVLRQTAGGTPALAIVGSPTWSDYTITLRARKTGGAEGFLIGFGMPDNTTKSWWNVGGWGNTQNAIESPGFSMLTKAQTIVTGRWYSLRIEVRGSDLRCYIDGVKSVDTTRLVDDAEWMARDDAILASSGLASLPEWELDQVRELLGRPANHGRALRARYDALPSSPTFLALPASEQAALIRKVNRYRMTWSKGWGWGGSELWRDEMVENSMEDAVMLYNRLGIFDKHLSAHISPGTPTADAGWSGDIRFGGSREYPVAIHEISHALGTGTIWQWGNLMVDGNWQGTYANQKVKEFDGPDAIMHGNEAHYWPYGQNQNWEWSPVNEFRTVSIVEAFRRDMGVSGVRDTAYTTDVPSGTYRLSPRLAPNSALEVPSGDSGAALTLRGYTGADNQKFVLEKQSDGTYVFRTALASGRPLDLDGSPENGAQAQLGDDNGGNSQRWYLVPTGDGFYKIAPRNNVWKGLDLWGVSSADGTPVKLWDFFDGFHQQYRLEKLG